MINTPRIPRALRDRVGEARRVFVITGAGISAESGVPTFRGKQGYWRNHNPLDLASPEGFARDPRLAWEWYLERRARLRRVEPNAGHRALARLERQVEARPGGAMLIATQNVDGLHQRAGSRRVVEVHGSIMRTRCTRTGREFEEGEVTVEGGSVPPISPAGALLRPAVVWFGENVPLEPIGRIQTFLEDPPDLALVIGTSALFGYIIAWALNAKSDGATLVEINPQRTDLGGQAHYALQAPAGQVLPELIPGESPTESPITG